jgi:NADPH:quinone reductase-like Zn-dependent oxidoreductase
MNALIFNDHLDEKIERKDVPLPVLGEGEVMVNIKAAALNRRDQWMREGMYPGTQSGVIMGSDGAGVVIKVAPGVDESWLGKEVIINPNINWGSNPSVQGKDYTILGMPVNGTLAEYVKVPAHRLHLKPAHLSWQEAAALPLGGLTAYRALISKGEPGPDHRILITGIGGGVATLALLFASAISKHFFITSGSAEKIDRAITLGAKGGFNYKKEDWEKEAKQVSEGGFDVIIDSAGGDGFNALLKLLRPGGRLIFYGATTGISRKLELHRMFWSQVRVEGSTMGNDEEFKAMVGFVEKHSIRPLVDEIFPFQQVISAFSKMKAGTQMGKIVVDIAE